MTLNELLDEIPGRFPTDYVRVCTAIRSIAARFPDGLETTVEDARRRFPALEHRPGKYPTETWRSYYSRFRRALGFPRRPSGRQAKLPGSLEAEIAEARQVMRRWPHLAAYIEPVLQRAEGAS